MQINEKRRLVVATGNAHKLREIAEIFTDFEVVSQKQMGFTDEVEETGTTFAENALIKARAAANALGCIALADDSGICVDALGGAPGVYSARYAGEHGSDKANRDLLLKNMENVTDRTTAGSCSPKARRTARYCMKSRATAVLATIVFLRATISKNLLAWRRRKKRTPFRTVSAVCKQC